MTQDKGASGMNYAPVGHKSAVCKPGEFVIAAIGLDHGHIYGMCNGLTEAGARLKWVYDPDRAKAERFAEKYEGVRIASSEEEVLSDPDVHMVASAAIPSDRCAVGMRAMASGKHYFVDKAPLTTLEQLAEARAMAASTGLKYAVYYGERLHSECTTYAGQLVHQGAIGRVVQVMGMGPHRTRVESRPDWFFKKERYGGILCDIGSHQIEQFLYFTGATDATIANSKTGNYNYPQYPEFEDFGDVTLIGNNGATGYFRLDWFTPDGLSTWGDGRTIILGTDGYIELRKYVDVGREESTDHVYLVNHEGERYMHVKGQVGHPYFGQLILDCLNGTEHAMTQEHAFKAAELSILAQNQAIRIDTSRFPAAVRS